MRLAAIIKGFSFGMDPIFFHEKVGSLLKLNEFMSMIVGEEVILGTHLFKQLDFNDLSWRGHEDERDKVRNWLQVMIENEFNRNELRDLLQWTTSLLRIPVEGIKIAVSRSNMFLAHLM